MCLNLADCLGWLYKFKMRTNFSYGWKIYLTLVHDYKAVVWELTCRRLRLTPGSQLTWGLDYLDSSEASMDHTFSSFFFFFKLPFYWRMTYVIGLQQSPRHGSSPSCWSPVSLMTAGVGLSGPEMIFLTPHSTLMLACRACCHWCFLLSSLNFLLKSGLYTQYVVSFVMYLQIISTFVDCWDGVSLCRLCWSGSYNLPFSTLQVLGLQACATIPLDFFICILDIAVTEWLPEQDLSLRTISPLMYHWYQWERDYLFILFQIPRFSYFYP